ncbi:hypothetical protein N7486_006184 [Penicillium sp. IBT 16267x]|nr:hypothetical protein N7486_006184 [Penicillium sp. IBT 16267x]
MHCAEAPRDRDIYRDSYNCSAMEFIQDAKLSVEHNEESKEKRTHNLVLAHMVNLDEEIDIPLLASTGTSVAHNPTLNLKLASGVAPVPAMLAHDPPVNVSLGTDGAPCSIYYDMFQEMHLAGILHKGVNHDASLIPAETALEMATINGAKALGLESEISSLEEQKKADFVVLDPYGRGGVGAAPWTGEFQSHTVSVVTSGVHGCTGRDVYMTVVDGEILAEDRNLANGGREKEMGIIDQAQRAIQEILLRCNKGREPDSKIGGKLAKGWSYV